MAGTLHDVLGVVPGALRLVAVRALDEVPKTVCCHHPRHGDNGWGNREHVAELHFLHAATQHKPRMCEGEALHLREQGKAWVVHPQRVATGVRVCQGLFDELDDGPLVLVIQDQPPVAVELDVRRLHVQFLQEACAAQRTVAVGGSPLLHDVLGVLAQELNRVLRRLDVHRAVPLIHAVQPEELIVQLADRPADVVAVHQLAHGAGDDTLRRSADLVGQLLPVVRRDVLVDEVERARQVSHATEQRVERTAEMVLAQGDLHRFEHLREHRQRQRVDVLREHQCALQLAHGR